MKNSSNKDKKTLSKEAIIGLGEGSFRKNYYAELQEKIHDLNLNNSRNNALMAAIPDLLLVANDDNSIYPFAQIAKAHRKLSDVIIADAEIRSQLLEYINLAKETRDLQSYEFQLEHGGRTLYLEARVQATYYSETLVIIRDITDKRLMNMELREMAVRDSLTGVYNRTYFERILEDMDGVYKQKMAIILIDIDGLKNINDKMGFNQGDRYIRQAARILQAACDETSMIARIGGDEFAILIEGKTRPMLEERLDQVSQIMLDYASESDNLELSLSYGYAFLDEGEFNSRKLFYEADNNMYQSKLLKESSSKSILLKTMMKALEHRDYITEGHTERMDDHAVKMGEKLGLRQNDMDRLRLLVKFHDIGKIGVPDMILNKEGPLTDSEWEIMKSHASMGKSIAEVSTELRDVASLIEMHHERWDGKGYPLGKAGYDIPLECRIVGIVDSFDAMTNNRPYRQALSREEAIIRIKEGSGSQFDSDLVDVFLEIVE